MELIIKIAILGIISCILALIIKEKTPYLSICIIIMAGIIILSSVFISLEQLRYEITDIISLTSIDVAVFIPVFKVCIISLIVKISSDICNDAGFSAIASKIQFAGSVTSLIIIFPLFTTIINILKDII